MAPVIGQRLLHYEIVDKLGEGGMGVVYKARDLELDRFVALKFLSPRLLASPEAVKRFEQEARSISALNHPHIATIHDIGWREGERFLVLECLPGGTLQSRLRQRRLRLEEIAGWGAQAADGLAHAHRHDIVHRDVKSANLMFTAEGTLKVTDFSLAKSPSSPDMTSPGTVVGTVSYMSPEQAQGLESDYRTDIFSLGVVLYEMATGEVPFRGPHQAAVMHQVINAPTPPVRAARPDLPEAFERVVFRATAKRPEERYRNMDELAEALRTLESAPEEAATITAAQPSRRARLSRRAGALAAALLASAAILTLTLHQSSLPAEKFLAVLPFANVGSDPSSQAFCDGLMETLTGQLNQLESIPGAPRVVPSADVRAEKLASAGQARRRFGVNLVLTGSVQRLGDSMRLTVNLVDAARIRQLRSRSFDTPLHDLTQLQDGLVSRTAEMLNLALRPDTRQSLRSGETGVPAAYDLYLQGLGFMQRYDVRSNVERAISLFQRSLERDGNYALAHAALGEAAWRMYLHTRDPQWIGEARNHSERAVQLNDRVSRAYLTLGLIEGGAGRYDDAIAQLHRALQLDPAAADTYRELARALAQKGKLEEAERTYRKVIDMWPQYWGGYSSLGVFYQRQGRERYADAERCLRRAAELAPDGYIAWRNLGGLLYLMGKPEEALRALNTSLAIQPTAQAYNNLGLVYRSQGDHLNAVRMLEQAVQSEGPERNDRRPWANLADSYRWSGAPQEKTAQAYGQAIGLAERDLGVNPRDAEVRSALALYHAALGEATAALAEIGKARRQAPDNVTVLYRAAVVYELLGQRSRALEAVDAARRKGAAADDIEKSPDLAALRRDPRYRKGEQP